MEIAEKIVETFVVRKNGKWQKLYKTDNGNYFMEATHNAGGYLGYLESISEMAALLLLK